MLTLNGKRCNYYPWKEMRRGDVVIVTNVERTRAEIVRDVRQYHPDAKVYALTAGAGFRVFVPDAEYYKAEARRHARPSAEKRAYHRKSASEKAIENRRRERRAWHRAQRAPAINPFS